MQSYKSADSRIARLQEVMHHAPRLELKVSVPSISNSFIGAEFGILGEG
jgi:arginine deiminase